MIIASGCSWWLVLKCEGMSVLKKINWLFLTSLVKIDNHYVNISMCLFMFEKFHNIYSCLKSISKANSNSRVCR